MDANDLESEHMKTTHLRKLWCNLPEQAGVYMIRAPNKKYYYGFSRNIKRRIYKHCYDSVKGRHHNKHLQKVILQHGRKCKIEVIHICNTAQQAIELEEQYIEMFYDDPNNINIAKIFPNQLQISSQNENSHSKWGDLPAAVLHLRSSVYGANLETTWKFFQLGVTSATMLKRVISNCTNRENLTCYMRFYLLGRWFTTYESCQDETGFSYNEINKNMRYAED